MSDSTCRICGEPVPGSARYCNNCDFQQAKDGRTVHEQSAPDRREHSRQERGSLSMFLLVFLVASVGTVGMGVTVTPGLSIPSLKATLGLGESMLDPAAAGTGELRTVSTRVRIRADRSTSSAIVGMIDEGERVWVDHLDGDWYAVFDPDVTIREIEDAKGYAYAPLLKPVPTPAPANSGGTPRSRS